MILMTGPNCPSCEKVKAEMNNKSVTILSTETVEGEAESAYHGIGMVPALIIDDEEVVYGVHDILRRVNDE